MINNLTSKQSQVIERFWKVGYFIIDDLKLIYSTETATRECIKRLLKLKIITEDNFIFKIDRSIYLELQ